MSSESCNQTPKALNKQFKKWQRILTYSIVLADFRELVSQVARQVPQTLQIILHRIREIHQIVRVCWELKIMIDKWSFVNKQYLVLKSEHRCRSPLLFSENSQQILPIG